jgi:catechol 2,3-dioxygenase-like lactoylglutathione lyase family enzyme
MSQDEQLVAVRYVVDDVEAAVNFYTAHLGFTLRSNPAPAFADVVRGSLRLLLSGPESSGARATPDENSGAGRNRVQLVPDDFDGAVEKLREAGLSLGSGVVEGPGGRQVVVADPAGNLVELFEPAARKQEDPGS